MGQATVGAMVVWNEELNAFDRKDFRHYNLESKERILSNERNVNEKS